MAGWTLILERLVINILTKLLVSMFRTEHSGFGILMQYTRGGTNKAVACDRWGW
jgi:hypothetical protein